MARVRAGDGRSRPGAHGRLERRRARDARGVRLPATGWAQELRAHAALPERPPARHRLRLRRTASSAPPRRVPPGRAGGNAPGLAGAHGPVAAYGRGALLPLAPALRQHRLCGRSGARRGGAGSECPAGVRLLAQGVPRGRGEHEWITPLGAPLLPRRWPPGRRCAYQHDELRARRCGGQRPRREQLVLRGSEQAGRTRHPGANGVLEQGTVGCLVARPDSAGQRDERRHPRIRRANHKRPGIVQGGSEARHGSEVCNLHDSAPGARVTRREIRSGPGSGGACCGAGDAACRAAAEAQRREEDRVRAHELQREGLPHRERRGARLPGVPAAGAGGDESGRLPDREPAARWRHAPADARGQGLVRPGGGDRGAASRSRRARAGRALSRMVWRATPEEPWGDGVPVGICAGPVLRG